MPHTKRQTHTKKHTIVLFFLLFPTPHTRFCTAFILFSLPVFGPGSCAKRPFFSFFFFFLFPLLSCSLPLLPSQTTIVCLEVLKTPTVRTNHTEEGTNHAETPSSFPPLRPPLPPLPQHKKNHEEPDKRTRTKKNLEKQKPGFLLLQKKKTQTKKLAGTHTKTHKKQGTGGKWGGGLLCAKPASEGMHSEQKWLISPLALFSLILSSFSLSLSLSLSLSTVLQLRPTPKKSTETQR